jgi:hypothetical protein
MKGFDLNGRLPCKEDWIAASTIESVEMLPRPDGRKCGSGPASNSYGEGIEHTQATVFQRRTLLLLHAATPRRGQKGQVNSDAAA